MVLDKLAVLKGEVAKLSANTQIFYQPEVNFQASTFGAPQHTASPTTFSGLMDSSCEDGELKEVTPRGSVLLQSAKALGSPDRVSEDTDPQVAAMINFLFDKGMQEEGYKATSQDVITRRHNNCPALAPVECNPQILGTLKTDV